MAIVQNKYPYEILFRLAKSGEVAGAHRRDLEVIEDTDTGIIYSEKEGDPQPVTGEAMETVLGVINTSLVATVAQRDQTIAQLQDSVSQLESDLSDKSQQLDDAQQTIDQLQQRIIELEQDLMNANQALDELQQLPEDALDESDADAEL